MRDYDGRTAQERVAERRQRLIDSGYALFGDVGYASVSIRAVLRHAELRDRYFAESFADLDELLAAVLDRIFDDEVRLCQTAVQSAQDPARASRAIISTLVASLEADPRRARIKLREAISAGPVVYACRDRGLRRLATRVASLLPTPTGGDPDPQQVALGLVAATNELLTNWLYGNGSDSSQAMTRDEVVQTVMFMFQGVADRYRRSPPVADTAHADGLRTP
ncbi:TetR/AcrR family transcriptional regulator [Streptomyces phaeochromogenes]|uniref:TetR/AcrR family transcriptional regulator n=1 Tax=Streptomyces phaeochromogenes TaxID=1923 RepID=UPI0033EADD19